jgi:acetylornithine deacetylase/succinyl-diaminopimelate desuccinylase-like protein
MRFRLLNPCRALWLTVLLTALLAPSSIAQSGSIDYDRLQNETVDLLSQYLQINTSNPPGNELATARWLQEVLAKEGIKGEILDTEVLPPGRANFYARLPGDGSKKAIALVHHMDVVPASPEYWSVDPFSGLIKDGYVWGRGALDMKGHGIVQLMALIAAKRAGLQLHRDIVFIANADEETDGLGTLRFVERHRDLLRDVEYLLTESGDSRLVGGKLQWYGINVGEKRAYWQRLEVSGRTSHGSVPTPGNPVPRLIRALARVSAWETPVHLTPAVDRYFKAQATTLSGEQRTWLSSVATALKNPRARAWLLSNPERNALLRNTVTATVLKGSNKTNTIPPTASAEIDIRLLPDEDTLAFRRKLLEVIGDTGVKVSTIGDVYPRFDAPLDTELFHALERVAAREFPGAPVATTVSTGASDRPIYASVGIVCYGIDPIPVEYEDAMKGVHGNDERIPVSAVGQGVRFYLEVLLEL